MPRCGRNRIGPRLEGGTFRLSTVPPQGPKLRMPDQPCVRCQHPLRRRATDERAFVTIEGERIGPFCPRCSRIFPAWLTRAIGSARYNFGKYGLTVASYWEMYRGQVGTCAICRNRRRGVRGLVVDHDHQTGRVRALLCARCNSAIGLLADDPEIVEDAARYLREHHARR